MMMTTMTGACRLEMTRARLSVRVREGMTMMTDVRRALDMPTTIDVPCGRGTRKGGLLLLARGVTTMTTAAAPAAMAVGSATPRATRRPRVAAGKSAAAPATGMTTTTVAIRVRGVTTMTRTAAIRARGVTMMTTAAALAAMAVGSATPRATRRTRVGVRKRAAAPAIGMTMTTTGDMPARG